MCCIQYDQWRRRNKGSADASAPTSGFVAADIAEAAHCGQQVRNRIGAGLKLHGRHQMLTARQRQKHPEHVVGVTRELDKVGAVRTVAPGEPVLDGLLACPKARAAVAWVIDASCVDDGILWRKHSEFSGTCILESCKGICNVLGSPMFYKVSTDMNDVPFLVI